LVPVLVAAGIHRLKAAVLTHPDLDHCGGLVDVARYLVVEEVWSAPFAGRSPCGAELLASPGAQNRTLWRGDELSLGRFRLRVLHPSAATPRRGEKVAGNDRSLVLMVEVFGRRLLFTGDLEATGERQILRRFRHGLKADVLKVAHHGSRSSTTAAFLRAVAPRLALVSAGANNPYGHPAKDVLARLRGAGAHVLRTDLHGMVRLKVSPAGALSWTTVKAPVASLEGVGTP
jgi:competence protein ComEC